MSKSGPGERAVAVAPDSVCEMGYDGSMIPIRVRVCVCACFDIPLIDEWTTPLLTHTEYPAPPVKDLNNGWVDDASSNCEPAICSGTAPNVEERPLPARAGKEERTETTKGMLRAVKRPPIKVCYEEIRDGATRNAMAGRLDTNASATKVVTTTPDSVHGNQGH